MGFKEKTCKSELIGSIAQTWLIIKHRAKNMLTEMKYDLTFEQIMVLHILGEEEGQNLGSLAEQADRERTTISRMVDGLEKRNLVVRVPDKVDKRQKLLYLTNLGKDRLEKMEPLGKKLHENIYQGIEEQEVEGCLATLTKILNNLEKK